MTSLGPVVTISQIFSTFQGITLQHTTMAGPPQVTPAHVTTAACSRTQTGGLATRQHGVACERRAWTHSIHPELVHLRLRRAKVFASSSHTLVATGGQPTVLIRMSLQECRESGTQRRQLPDRVLCPLV